jgi:glycosyltransferase involved in cell wall biosynthesis
MDETNRHKMKITVITKIPSPYQVELLDQISSAPDIRLFVVYLRRGDLDRSWKARELKHTAVFLEDGAADSISGHLRDSDLVVFSWYRDPAVRRFIGIRARSGKPWCFWGERPGFRFKGVVGKLYRRWMLRELFANANVPIWGIGHWAVEGYESEFGRNRKYYNVPYVSDISKFLSIPERRTAGQTRVVLFSGSLIERKGVLELCEAFLRIAQDMPGAYLHLLGSGPLEPKLRSMSARSTQIQFLGFRDWDELQNVYADADILCAPSRYDGWGLMVIEGLASGLPVIASSSVGAALEAIVEGRNGWLIHERNADDLEARLRSVLSLPNDEINTMRHQCRDSAMPFGIEAGTNRFLNAAKATLENWQQ